MILSRIEASGFRNLEGFAEFDPGLNIFYGDNAQGKTNWLEAIYLLGTTKSFRTTHVRDCVRFDASQCLLSGDVNRGSITRRLQLLLGDSTRELYVNGKREALVRYLGNLDVFAFSLEELEVVRGEPGQRRRFVDRGIVTVSPSYLGTLSRYNQIVKQKNKLLAEASKSESPRNFERELQAWNEQMIEFGSEVHGARAEYVDRLNNQLESSDQGRGMFHVERVAVRYRSSLDGKGDLGDFPSLFRERLMIRMAAEMAVGHSLIGPHRDDLEILCEGRDVARFGSAGQQRSALLLLDLARVSIYNSLYEESPVLLIDDVDAELDRGRIEALLSELQGRAQTFVSTSRRAIANRYSDRAAVFLVTGGIASQRRAENAPATGAPTADSSDGHPGEGDNKSKEHDTSRATHF